MDTMRGILFLVVTLIIIVSIYYIVKMVKGRTESRSTPSPSPSDQTGEISISDLNFERTLNPDKSNSEGDDGIVGYTIEYDGVNYQELSKNVTFTLNWKNNIGFTDKVKGFKIEHYVSGDDSNFPTSANQSINFLATNTNIDVNVNNFQQNSLSIVSNGYSVVGKNRFKISVIMNNDSNSTTLIYDGTTQTDDSHEIVISEQDLGATLNMTQPQTVTYKPVTQSFSYDTDIDIVKIKYSINNNNSSLNYEGGGSIYLIPAFGGITKNGEKKSVDTFFFKYELGENQYLLYDAKKGKWNESVKRHDNDNIELKGVNTTGNDPYDNRMFVSFYNKVGNKTQMRAPVMGHGLGGDFLTSDENGTIVLKDLSSTGTVSETEFTNSEWTFEEVEGEPKNCKGEWVVDDDGTTSGTKIEIFNIISSAINNGTCEASDGDTRETDVDVDCIGTWGPCQGGICGTGKKTYKVTRERKNNGKYCKSNGDIVKDNDKKDCNLGPCLL